MSDSRYEEWQRFCEESDRQVADFNAKPQKHCPFCGGEAEAHWNYDGDYDPHFVIECKSCEARVKTYCFDEAVRNWNLRVDEEAHRRELETRAIIAGVSLADAVDEEHKREVKSYKRLLKTSQCALEDEIVKNQNLNREVASIRSKLKVAEDALEKVYKCIDNRYGVDASLLAKSIIADAIDSIREEGGEKTKPIRNCDRFETAEDAYDACPQFCDIDVKTMSKRELKILEATTKRLEWLFASIREDVSAK